MNFTKDELTIIRHGLDLMCRSEGNGLAQTGLDGIMDGRLGVLASRLTLAADLDARINAEFALMVEEEKAAADKAAGKKV